MVGTAVTQARLPGMPPTAASGGGLSPAFTLSKRLTLNSYRISAVIYHLNHYFQGGRKLDPVEFMAHCCSLARGIDFAIANHNVPSKSQELPPLIKQVCKDRDDPQQLAAIMVLMISVKGACQRGWFSEKDSEELNNLAKEIASNFGNVLDFSTVPSGPVSDIFTIMSRFYPNLRLGNIFVLLNVKPGFEAYVADFQIAKNIKRSPHDKFRLFVAQTDNIETSSCLVSPAKVNFLLNGVGVERRINSSMDKGPQMPTVITNFLKYGSNLLQAVGEFSGNYIIAVAFMSELPSLDSSALQDYELQATAVVDPDSEIIEGQSRISLNCPISHQRIRIPVKGCSCRHVQCFDFNNYVEINSRRPSWRCPSCNQSVCFADIRIDTQMVKVLQEVGPNVSNVIISADGSWDAAMESDATIEKAECSKARGKDESQKPDDIMDLTLIDDAMDVTDALGTGGVKDPDQFQFVNQSTTDPHITNSSDVNQSASPVPDDFWSGLTFPIDVQADAQVAGDFTPTSASTDVLSFPTAEFEVLQGDAFTMLQKTWSWQKPQFGNPSISNDPGRFMTQTPNSVQSLPTTTPNPMLQLSNKIFSPNHVSAALQASSSPPSLPSSLPVETGSHVVQQCLRNSANTSSASSQALPPAPAVSSTFHSQSPTSVLQHSSGNVVYSTISNSFPAASQGSATAPRMVSTAYHANPRQALNVALPQLYQHRHAQQSPFPLAQPPRQTQQNPVPLAQPPRQTQQNPVPLAQPPRQTQQNPFPLSQNGLQVPNDHRNSNQQVLNLQAPRSMSQQSPVHFQSSVRSPHNWPPQGHVGNRSIHGNGQTITQQAHLIAAANRTAQMATDTQRPPPSLLKNHNIYRMPSPGDQSTNMGAASQPVRRTEESYDPSDTNWRPAARMRGALTGQAYVDALNQFVIRPSQQAQAARPMPNMVSPQLQSLMSGGVTQGATSAPSKPSNNPSG